MNDKDKKPEDEKRDDAQPEAPSETPEEKPQDAPQDEEKAENEEVSADEKEPTEGEEKPGNDSTESADKPPELSEEDKLREENFRLKTQLEAMKIGFTPDVLEDAVVLAENIVKRDGTEITAALEAVAKKYPDWKGGKDKGKPAFRVGADASKKSAPDDDRINRAFGLKKKG